MYFSPPQLEFSSRDLRNIKNINVGFIEDLNIVYYIITPELDAQLPTVRNLKAFRVL